MFNQIQLAKRHSKTDVAINLSFI